MDEEYDNDYAENYFDNGEGDDNDELGGGGGGDEGGGMGLLFPFYHTARPDSSIFFPYRI